MINLKYLKLLLVSVIVVIFSACSAGPMGVLPPLDNQREVAIVTLIRSNSFIGASNNFRITLDGKNIFSIRSGQYTNFKLNEGTHAIGVTCFGGWTPTPKREYIDVVVNTHTNLYFLIAPNLSCAGIDKIDALMAEKLISDSKYVSMQQKLDGI